MKKILLYLALILETHSILSQNVPSYVPNVGLVGWWGFNGNAIDSSGNGNNGLVNNALLSADRFGKINNCYGFNGANSSIEIDDAVILDAHSITISGWFYNASSPQNVTNLAQSLVAKWYYEINCGSEGDAYTVLLINSSNKSKLFGGAMNYNIVNGGIQSDIAVAPNRWYHFIFIHDEKKGGELYLDCKLVGSNNISGPICATSNKLYFGADNRFGQIWRHFSGKIDDIGIWNRALTPCEIQGLCESRDINFSIFGPDFICENDTVSYAIGGVQDTISVTWQVDGNIVAGANSNMLNIFGVENPKVISASFEYNCKEVEISKVVSTFKNSPETKEKMTICEGEEYKGYKTNGNYIIYLQNVDGCDSTVILDLKVNLANDEKVKDTIICSNSILNFYGSAINAPGKYSKIFKNQFGCDSVVSILVKFSLPSAYFLQRDTSLCNVEKYVLTSNYENTIWNDGSTGKKLTIYNSGNYTGTIIDDFGCITTDTVSVNIESPAYFPNIFSPNNDNKNDYFFPTFSDNSIVSTLILSIYDRWGNQVFSSETTSDLIWDGTFNGQKCGEGNYTYILSNTICPDSKIKGVLTLVR